MCTIPILKITNRNENNCAKAVTVVIVLLISYFSMKEKAFDIILGGGYLFGGTYLTILYCGIEFGRNDNRLSKLFNKNIKKSLIIVSFLLLLSVLFIYKNKFEIDNMIFGSIFYNPPNLSIIVYSVLIIMFIYIYVAYFEQFQIKQINSIINIVNYIGKHTLYIFLYHNYLIGCIMRITFIQSHTGIPITVLVSLLIMFVSLAIEYLSKLISSYISIIVRKITKIN